MIGTKAKPSAPGRARAEGEGEMSENVLAKAVVTIVILIGFLVWRTSERSNVPSCINCPTDLSASRK
jgi:hypothetical protein